MLLCLSPVLCSVADGKGTDLVSSIMAIPDGGSEDDQALLDRIAKREERRQRRMRDALERQKSLDPAVGDGLDGTNGTEERSSSHSEHQRDGAVEEPTHNEVSTHETSSSREKRTSLEAPGQ